MLVQKKINKNNLNEKPFVFFKKPKKNSEKKFH